MGVEIPWKCTCGRETMLDLENMETRSISKIYSMEGYTCASCERWQITFCKTLQLEESLYKLNRMHPFNSSFAYHLSKTLKRAEEIQRRGRELYGKIDLPHMVEFG